MRKPYFSEFSDNDEVVPIPAVMITNAFQKIDDIDELKVILNIFRLLAQKKDTPKTLTFTELCSDELLLGSLSGNSRESKIETLRHALIQAVQHEIILRTEIAEMDSNNDIYHINSMIGKYELNSNRIASIESARLSKVPQLEEMRADVSSIFSLYEQNIGLLTPFIVEDLQEAEKLYPGEWIESAFREAVALNKRNWRYIVRILERWAREGKNNGKPGEYTEKKNDPDRYIRGKYGHMVQR